jgi:uncharacterized membrane protein
LSNRTSFETPASRAPQDDKQRDDKQLVRRLEAFSDIVIAFSLAQTALNLVIPAHAADFVTRPIGIVGFVITFTVIATFWWNHLMIFRHYFVANSVMVFINFVALASVVLQVFVLQLWLHFGPTQSDGVTAAKIYFGVFVETFAMVALLLALGTFFRWRELSSLLRQDGIKKAIRISCTVLGAGIGIAFASRWLLGIPYWFLGIPIFTPGHATIVVFPGSIFLGLLVGDIVGQILAAVVTRRMPKFAATRE